ncbi:MAG TPA: hypothetical protein DCG57_08690 [Candidatus Riflebacteria bacterium]|nr:hypothetical protein [Candidatus Riflebacteria bacterium]
MEREQDDNRWALPDIAIAINWADERKRQKIAVALDPLGEYAQNIEQANDSAESYLATTKAIADSACAATLAVKLSALGLNFDRSVAESHLKRILAYAEQTKILIEIDIEGTPTVPAVCEIAQKYAGAGYRLVLALQAYLDRTPADLQQSLRAGLKIRLVKGAYCGDTDDFGEIQQRFVQLFKLLQASRQPFDVGTHDPVLLEKMTELLDLQTRDLVCFGFLKGLADQSKLDMTAGGLKTAEYVPFGNNRRAYISRRQAYLKRLQKLGLRAAP